MSRTAKLLRTLALCSCVTLLATAIVDTRALAQSTVNAALTLKDGTPVKLIFARSFTSSDVLAGETVQLYAAADVRVGGVIVIPKNSPAQATVMLARAKQKVGMSGRLELRFDSVRLSDGENAPLRLTQSIEPNASKGVQAGLEASAVTGVFPATLILMSKTGKDVEIARNEDVVAYVNHDVPLDAAKFAHLDPAPGIPVDADAPPVRDGTETQAELQRRACGPEDVAHRVWKVDDATPPTIPPGQALIYVVRPSLLGTAMQAKLSVDRNWVGVNRSHTYFYFTIAPGTHYFCSKVGDLRSIASMVVEAGHTYYLRQTLVYGSTEIEWLNESEGKAALAKCKRTEFAQK